MQVRAPQDALLKELEATGVRLSLAVPGESPIKLGRPPSVVQVRFHSPAASVALEKRDLLALAEAYLAGEVDVEGDLLELMKITDVLLPDPGPWERFRYGLRLLLRNRRRLQRESVAFHYDRPPEFFLPWFERWRSYSHGLYAHPDEEPSLAQERKLARALGALDVKPGDVVFDMGCGWGAFLEYAGLRGIRVHGITISEEQHRFVAELIRERELPCRVEQVDFLDFQPAQPFAGAVFMGTFEHFPDYAHAARFLSRWLKPQGRVWADFCTARGSRLGGAFLKKYVWPGNTRYVDVPRLIEALDRCEFNIHELVDDTESYAWTVRDWAEGFDACAPDLEKRFGREPVRAFRLFLRASQYFLEQNRTQAYHLVAGRHRRPVEQATASPHP